MNGFFVSGTDTNVGKTIASTAFLARALTHFATVGYHKPIQSGILTDNDQETVRSLLPASSRISASMGLGFKKPLSPHLAAYYEHTSIDFPSVVRNTKEACINDFNIVEGAGGLMVPINHRYLMIDLIKALELPCLLVARSALGTINHTLLSLQALKAKQIPILGVVMVGAKNRDNEASVYRYGRIKNLIALPYLPSLNQGSLMTLVEERKNQLDQFLMGFKK